MDLKISDRNVYLMAFFGIIMYVILIVIAMFSYPGGTRDNSLIPIYSFWDNTFSDLGRVTAWNGESNLVSMILFTLAYGIQVISMIPFYIRFMNIFSEGNIERKFSKIGSYFGIISSIAFIGILFTPADLLNGPHWFFVFIGYPSILVMGIFYSIVLILNDRFSKIFAYIFTGVYIIYFVALLVGLIGISFSRTIMVIGQKILTFALLVDFSILIYSVWNLKENKNTKTT